MLPMLAVALVLTAPVPCEPEAAGCRAPSPRPDPARYVKALDRALRHAGSAKRLLHDGGRRARFHTPIAGTLTVRWADGKGTVASARHRFTAAGDASIHLRLTRHGRRVLRSGIRGFLTHTQFLDTRGGSTAGSVIDGEVNLT